VDEFTGATCRATSQMPLIVPALASLRPLADVAAPAAKRQAEALGFIRETVRGSGGNAEHRHPSCFLLISVNNPFRRQRRRPQGL
jgi:hypothetical protein